MRQFWSTFRGILAGLCEEGSHLLAALSDELLLTLFLFFPSLFFLLLVNQRLLVSVSLLHATFNLPDTSEFLRQGPAIRVDETFGTLLSLW